MVQKGTLEAFNVAKLVDLTIDERRNVRKLLKKERNPDLKEIQALLKEFMISDKEIVSAKNIPSILETINPLISWFIEDLNNSKVYEPLNVHRMTSVIKEVPEAFKNNIKELEYLVSFQHAIAVAIKDVLQTATISILDAEKKASKLIPMITNGELKPYAMINEVQQDHVGDLAKRFANGYIYHWSIQDELKKVPFEIIFENLSDQQKRKFKQMCMFLNELKDSINSIYLTNWKQIGLIKRTYSILHECMKSYY